MSLLSRLINLMHLCWIKFIIYKKTCEQYCIFYGYLSSSTIWNKLYLSENILYYCYVSWQWQAPVVFPGFVNNPSSNRVQEGRVTSVWRSNQVKDQTLASRSSRKSLWMGTRPSCLMLQKCLTALAEVWRRSGRVMMSFPVRRGSSLWWTHS